MENSHATVIRDGFTVPLIGIPKSSVLETCDLCGVEFSIGSLTFTGKQMLCKKCESENHARPTAKT